MTDESLAAAIGRHARLAREAETAEERRFHLRHAAQLTEGCDEGRRLYRVEQRRRSA